MVDLMVTVLRLDDEVGERSCNGLFKLGVVVG